MLLTYRYLFKLVDSDQSDQIRVCYHTADEKGHEEYISVLKSMSDLVSLGREYVSSYDVSKIGIFETLYKSEEVKENEKV